MGLGSIKSFDLHFPVCAFSRVYWLFTYLRRTVYSCTRSIFLCVCVVSVHTKAHMCRPEDNMWELWVLGEKTMWTWGLNSIQQACWQTPLPMEWSHQALVPLFESDNLLWFLSFESSLCILGISLSSYAPQVCPILWVTSNSVASFLYSDHQTLESPFPYEWGYLLPLPTLPWASTTNWIWPWHLCVASILSRRSQSCFWVSQSMKQQSYGYG